MILYEYECLECNDTFEDFSSVENRDAMKPCPQCGRFSQRVVTGTRFVLEGVSGHFPTAADQWARRHEQGAKKEH
jgi:putative FmdB family regulatory protein